MEKLGLGRSKNIINDFDKIYGYNGNILKTLYFEEDNYE